MRKIFAALTVAALALTGCGTTGEDKATVTNTPVATSASTATSATSSGTPTGSTTEEQPAAETVAPPAEQPAVVPAPVEHVSAPTGLMHG